MLIPKDMSNSIESLFQSSASNISSGVCKERKLERERERERELQMVIAANRRAVLCSDDDALLDHATRGQQAPAAVPPVAELAC